MSKKILIISLFALFLNACGANATTNSTANSTNVTTASGGNAPNTNQNTAVSINTNANTNAAKPADNSPKRIVFNKGANWGTANLTLAPGTGQKFVIGAKSGQTMDVEVSSKETSVNLIKGKAQTTEDFGYLNAELQSNGDYIFEVRNLTKKEIKTSVKVTIEGGEKAKTDEIDESDATVKDDPDVLPPPTTNKKRN